MRQVTVLYYCRPTATRFVGIFPSCAVVVVWLGTAFSRTGNQRTWAVMNGNCQYWKVLAMYATPGSYIHQCLLWPCWDWRAGLGPLGICWSWCALGLRLEKQNSQLKTVHHKYTVQVLSIHNTCLSLNFSFKDAFVIFIQKI